jgi:hypothetical protein
MPNIIILTTYDRPALSQRQSPAHRKLFYRAERSRLELKPRLSRVNESACFEIVNDSKEIRYD